MVTNKKNSFDNTIFGRTVSRTPDHSRSKSKDRGRSLSSGFSLSSVLDSGSGCSSKSPLQEREKAKKKLISKPIVDGKTYTTILYEIAAGLDIPMQIKYFQIDADAPRTRNGRFVIECHLDDQCYGVGEGSSKKAAKQLASKLALTKLLKERPYLEESVTRIRQGFPSRKKLDTRHRRRRSNQPEDRRVRRQQNKHQQHLSTSRSHSNRSSKSPTSQMLRELQERQRLQLEYEMVNRMVQNIESLTSYLGFPGMTPHETSLLANGNRQYDEYPQMNEAYEGTFVRRPPSSSNQPSTLSQRGHRRRRRHDGGGQLDTLDYMRQMKARSAEKEMGPTHTLNARAKEYEPQGHGFGGFQI